MAAEPTLAALEAELKERVDARGEVPVGVAEQLQREKGWGGRLLEVLALLTRDAERMGYLAGGRRPDEVATWLSVWHGSDLSLPEIELVVESGGWDPEPFVVLGRAGLLERLLRRPDGTVRRVRGELAGGWASDNLALADEAEILREVAKVLQDQEDAGAGG